MMQLSCLSYVPQSEEYRLITFVIIVLLWPLLLLFFFLVVAAKKENNGWCYWCCNKWNACHNFQFPKKRIEMLHHHLFSCSQGELQDRSVCSSVSLLLFQFQFCHFLCTTYFFDFHQPTFHSKLCMEFRIMYMGEKKPKATSNWTTCRRPRVTHFICLLLSFHRICFVFWLLLTVS